MAYDHNILLVPHGWNTAVRLAGDLNLVTALPIARWVLASRLFEQSTAELITGGECTEHFHSTWHAGPIL